jgi:hypothetical protein
MPYSEKANPLAHQQAVAMQHQHALLLHGSREQAHGRPAHRLTYRLSVARMVLLAFDVGLH